MIDEIVWYNLASFLFIWLIVILYSILYSFNKKIAIALGIIFLIIFVFLMFLFMVSIGEGDIVAKGWYYYIGNVIAGITWRSPFKIGKDIYLKIKED